MTREYQRIAERQWIAAGGWPRTLWGWWFWVRYWSSVPRIWRRLRAR
jgi:hypothetical protein